MDMQNVSPFMMPIEGVASGIRNSSKAQSTGYGYDFEIFAIKMAKAVGMELRGSMSASSPLTLDRECCEAGFRFAEAGFPIGIGSGPMYGASGPATIAGSTITNNAEIIAEIVLVQLIKQGTGVLACDFGYPLDMISGNPAFGNVGTVLQNIVFAQIWRHYDIPVGNWSAGFCNSKKIDFQNGYERSMSVLISALAGFNLCNLHGAIHGELTYHPVMSILYDDIAGWVGRFIEGVEVNDETLAIDLIEQVGPIPGQYLNTAHTRKWWQQEQFIPKSADREPYPEWIKKGKKDAVALAGESNYSVIKRILLREPKALA
ncbi:trimethylamine methyltransferase family protein [Chloroflexota bacterium]